MAKKKAIEEEKPAANFIMRYKYIVKKPNETIRVFELENWQKQKAEVSLDSSSYTSLTLFLKEISKKGNFHYFKGASAFQGWLNKIESEGTPIEIDILDQYGYNPEYDIFVTPDYIFTKDGPLKWSKKHKAFRFKLGLKEDGEELYKNLRLSDMLKNSNIRIAIDKPVSKSIYKGILKGFIERQKKSMNDNLQGQMALAHLRSILYGTHIVESTDGSFPFLLVVGEMGSGKSEFIRLITKIFGITTSAETGSVVGIERLQALYRDFPFWIEEYGKDVRKTEQLDPLLVSAFTRSTLSKAALGKQGEGAVISIPVTACLLLSGEDTSEDIAVRSRFIQIRLSRNLQNRQGKQELDEFAVNASKIGSFWIDQKIKDDIPAVLKGINDEVQIILGKLPHGVSDIGAERMVKQHATLQYFMKRNLKDAGLEEDVEGFILGHLLEYSNAQAEEKATMLFWNDFIKLINNNDAGNLIPGVDYYYASGTQSLHLNWIRVEGKLRRLRRMEGVKHSHATQIKKYLENDYQWSLSKARPNDKRPFNSIKFELTKLPEFVQTYFDSEPVTF